MRHEIAEVIQFPFTRLEIYEEVATSEASKWRCVIAYLILNESFVPRTS
jgi:hypothetical protein